MLHCPMAAFIQWREPYVFYKGKTTAIPSQIAITYWDVESYAKLENQMPGREVCNVIRNSKKQIEFGKEHKL